jgi:hypothetical protein
MVSKTIVKDLPTCSVKQLHDVSTSFAILGFKNDEFYSSIALELKIRTTIPLNNHIRFAWFFASLNVLKLNQVTKYMTTVPNKNVSGDFTTVQIQDLFLIKLA